MRNFSGNRNESLREGGSPRARVFRAKDEILDFTMDDVRASQRGCPAPSLDRLFEASRAVRDALDATIEAPDDEGKADAAISLIREYRRIAHELGIPGAASRHPPPPERVE